MKTHRLETYLWALLFLYGLAIHVAFVVYIPDPIFQPDSISYIEPALNLLFRGNFAVTPDRTAAYPLFLSALLASFDSFYAVLIAQHALAIATGVLAGLVCFKFLGGSFRAGLITAWLTANLPHTVLASHGIMTETLYTFLALAAILLLLTALDHASIRHAAAAGFVAALAVVVRPAGWALAVAGVVSGYLYIRQRPSRRVMGLAAAAFVGVIIAVSTYNMRRHGFFGLDLFAGQSLFGTTAEFLDVDRIENDRVREALRPIYQTAEYRQHFKSVAWVRYAPEGPGTRMSQLFNLPAELNKALLNLSFKSIAAHPFLFMADQLTRVWDFVWRRYQIFPLFFMPEFEVVIYRGLALYDRSCERFPEGRRLTCYEKKEFADYFAQMEAIKHMTDEQAESVLATQPPPRAYRYDKILALERPLVWLLPVLKWLPLISLIVAGALAAGPARRAVLILLSFVAAHIILTTLGADRTYRHIIPVEPIFWAFLLAGLRLPRRKTVA